MPHTFTSSSKPIAANPNVLPVVQGNNNLFTSTIHSTHFQPNNTTWPASSTTSPAPYFANINSHYTKQSKEKNPHFKELYPETRYDEKQKQYYRVIDKIYKNKKLDEQQKVNVRAWEVGENAYLFTGKTPSKNVVISTHGSYNPDNCKNIIELKPGMPDIIFLSPHNYSIEEKPYWGILNKYAKVTHAGITILSEHAQETFYNDEYGYEEITGTSLYGAICNYNLSKFEENSTRLAEFKIINQREKDALSVDMLDNTPRKTDLYIARKKRPSLSLKDLLEHATKNGYTQIFCSFCRAGSNITDKNDLDDYVYRGNKLLSTPIFKSWEDIAEIAEG